jgi:hypothetical protein
MTLRDSLALALQTALTPIVKDLGCRCTVYRPTASTGLDASTTRAYAADGAWSNVSVIFVPVTNDAGANATVAIAKPFGVRSSAKSTITFLRTAAGLPTIVTHDGFKILDGPYAGFTWLAEADGVIDPVGATMAVTVIAAPAGNIS